MSASEQQSQVPIISSGLVAGTPETQQNEQTEPKIASFPKLEHSFFTEEQAKYLTMLAKYSGRRLKYATDGDLASTINTASLQTPVRKDFFIKEYLSYLSVDEQVDYNDQKIQIDRAYQYSYYFGFLGAATAFTYFLITVPTTRALLKETVKSAAAGIFTGYCYYKVNQVRYQQKIDSYFILVLNRLADRKRAQQLQ